MLIVVGDIDVQAVRARVEELFAPIPAGPPPPPVLAVEPKQTGERRVTVRQPGTAQYFQAAFHVPDARHADNFPLMVLDAVLGGASPMTFGGGSTPTHRSARLYTALVETELASRAGCSYSPSLDPGLFSLPRPPCARGARWRKWSAPSGRSPAHPRGAGQRRGTGQGAKAGPGAICLCTGERHQPGALAGPDGDGRHLHALRHLPRRPGHGERRRRAARGTGLLLSKPIAPWGGLCRRGLEVKLEVGSWRLEIRDSRLLPPAVIGHKLSHEKEW